MKKKLILGICALVAGLAQPALACDSVGAYVNIREATPVNQQTIKESSTTFVIAVRGGKVEGEIATSKPGVEDNYLVKRIDSGPTAPGLITASHDKGKGLAMISSSVKSDNEVGAIMLTFDTKAPQVGLDLKTATVTSARALVTGVKV